MGTNYYWHEASEEKCVCGARHHRVLHVGKQSVGWAFGFRVYGPESDFPQNSEEWRNWMIEAEHMAGGLYDEYGARIQVEKFWSMADDRERKAAWDIYAYYAHLKRPMPPGTGHEEFRDAHGHRCVPHEFS